MILQLKMLKNKLYYKILINIYNQMLKVCFMLTKHTDYKFNNQQVIFREIKKIKKGNLSMFKGQIF